MAQKILYVCPNASIGGAEKATFHFALAHIKEEFLPHILFFKDGPLVEHCRRQKIAHTVIPFSIRLSNPFSLIRAKIFIHFLVKKESIDLVHNCMPYAQIVSSWSYPCPTVLYQHGPVGGKLDKLANVFPCDHIFTNSFFTKAEHQNSTSLNPPIEVCALAPLRMPPIEDNIPDPLETNANSNDQFTIGLVGRFDPWKGIDFGIKACAPLLMKNPKIKIIVVGGPFENFHRDYAQEIRKLPEELGIGQQVIFVGATEQVQYYFGKFDVFIHSSLKPEPFGLTILEAMAEKCLVLAANSGGVPEIIQDRINGFLYKMGDASSLCEALEPIVAGTIDAETIRSNALSGLDNKYSSGRMIEQVEARYRKLLTEKSG